MYQDLDRGDGVCKYFDVSTKLCTIYKERPLKCRVEEGYDVYFKDIPYTEYLEQTYAGCVLLQDKLKEKEQKHGGADWIPLWPWFVAGRWTLACKWF